MLARVSSYVPSQGQVIINRETVYRGVIDEILKTRFFFISGFFKGVQLALLFFYPCSSVSRNSQQILKFHRVIYFAFRTRSLINILNLDLRQGPAL